MTKSGTKTWNIHPADTVKDNYSNISYMSI